MRKTKNLRGICSSLVLVTMTTLMHSLPVNAVSEDVTLNTFTNSDLSGMFDKSGFKDCANVLLNETVSLDVNGDMFDAHIGTPFSILHMDAELDIKEITNCLYYPVIDNNNIVAFIVASKNNGEISFSCGSYFAPELNSNMPQNESFILLSDDGGNVYAIDGNNSIYYIYSVTATSNQEVNTDQVSEYPKSMSADSLKTNEASLLEWYNPSRAILDVQLNNYPCTTQNTGYNNCWAHSIYSISKYKLGISYVEQVYGAYYTVYGENPGNNGITTEKAYGVIEYLFERNAPGVYSPVRTYSQLSSAQIVKNINADLPVYIRGSNAAGGLGHAVALMGYRRDTTYLVDGNVVGFYVMNSQRGNIEYHNFSTTNCYFYDSSGVTQYLWDDSINLKGTL